MRAMSLLRLLALGAVMLLTDVSAYAATKTPPYWASLSASEARMRVGPSLDYPANWVYRRKYLPVKVIQVLNNWRKIEDPAGTQGWMHVRLLSDAATAIVVVDEGELHEKPDDSARLKFRAEKGVVGKVEGCKDGWCQFDVGGKRGYILATSLWGDTE
jgi:SH3-like domain-containing protein